MAIAVFNQLSGINAVLYYAPHIFKMAGAGVESALLQSVAIGGTFVIFTMLAISIIDKFGRKTLMIVGSVGYIISLAVTAWAFYTYGTEFDKAGSTVVLISVLVFMASHSFGQGTVIWVFISEIFPNRIRGAAVSVAVFSLWTGSLTLTYTFPFLNTTLGTANTYWMYAVICGVGFLILRSKLPETKGKTLEEIEIELLG